MIKKITFSIAIFVLLAGTFNSCLDYDELRENPNAPTMVPPSLLFTNVTPTTSSAFSDTYEYPQYHIRSNSDGNPISYRFGSRGFRYGTLRNVLKMEEEADRVGAPVYKIMAKFFKAYNFVDMCRSMGDVPLREALLAAENTRPKYDTQKTVYIQCLDWLEEANLELGEFISNNPVYVLEGDAYFNGDLTKWQKVINAYAIRVMLTLSKKANDTDLNIKGRLATMLDNPQTYPLMTSLNDNMQLAHQDEDGYRGYYNPNNATAKVDIILANTFVDMLKDYEDPRLKAVADPTPSAMEANSNEDEVRNDFNSYNGGDPSASTADNVLVRSSGGISNPNEDKYWNFVGQPTVLIGYFEQELNIAEAAHRGWVSANAQDHYNNGVKASMEFFGVEEDEADAYLASKAPYTTGDAGLTRIHEQMYIAFFENSGWESFFLNRRTGVPAYKFSGENLVDKLPLRWAYPQSENDNNYDNYRAALISQFGAEVDDRDQIIWELKD
ncbi:SusD/RagB family nutrient-binding outer membrane lipoprotein [Aestuariivivens insulae]|uniref:SusD/RagB family nutrient-binding outer membrane lipoprotein n=1 Tax=Aestuariivivens insulae TaxID=1621988 RepID=UPI001F5A1E21|nr:SusD/RagB family nutrient-binding outer membrane lipoprotein [Aestuariivivens insulae]